MRRNGRREERPRGNGLGFRSNVTWENDQVLGFNK